MRKTFALWLVLALAVTVLLAGAMQNQRMTTGISWRSPVAGNGNTSSGEDAIPVQLNDGNNPHWGGNPLDVVDSSLFSDDYEGGHAAWTSVDILANTVEWHPSAERALGGSGTTWWCADEATIHAYDNHWLQYLILPVVDLSSAPAPVLAFKARWACENPGAEPAGYDMWDSWNIWGSTDGGTTWTVLEPSAPDASPTNPNTNYTGQSSYAFGSEWGMGLNIPAYGGNTFSSSDYSEVIVPLTALAGSANARVRIAFCSDPSFSGNPAGSGGGDSLLYFGLLVDSLRVTDGALLTTLYSNDGTADGLITMGIGPVSPDTWVYDTDTNHSATHSWHGAQTAYNVTRALKSYAVTLPAGYQNLKMTYWVWCDLPDWDGNGDGFLEDYYIIRSSTDQTHWTQVTYDYAYDNGESAPGGNSATGWVKRTHGVGTLAIPLFSRTLAPNDTTVYVAIELNLDNNDDGGSGTGLHIDDVEFIAQRAQLTDLATQDMRIPYPTTAGIARPWSFVFKNEGLSALSPVRGKLRFTKPDGTFFPPTGDSIMVVSGALNYAEDTTVTRVFTPGLVGGWVIRTIANATGELDRTNDTTLSPPIPYGPILTHSDSTLGVWVRPAGVYELGHCPQRRVTNASSGLRYEYFTPLSDGVPAGDAANFDLLQLRVVWRYDNEIPPAGAHSLIQFWSVGPNDSTPGSLIYSLTTQIDTNETAGAGLMSRWWTMNLSTIPQLHNLSGNFWVSVAAQDSNTAGEGMPIPLCFREPNGTPHDNHSFVLSGPNFNRSLNRNFINVVIGQAVEDVVIHRGITPSSDLILSWTAAAGASKYYVWRLTTPGQLYNTGTLLTPGGITANTYTDVGRLGASSKDFYVVITEY